MEREPERGREPMEPRPSPGALEPSSTRIAPQGSPSRITITEAEGRLRLRLGAALGDRLRRDADGSRSLRPGRPRSPSMARPGRGGGRIIMVFISVGYCVNIFIIGISYYYYLYDYDYYLFSLSLSLLVGVSSHISLLL